MLRMLKRSTAPSYLHHRRMKVRHSDFFFSMVPFVTRLWLILLFLIRSRSSFFSVKNKGENFFFSMNKREWPPFKFSLFLFQSIQKDILYLCLAYSYHLSSHLIPAVVKAYGPRHHQEKEKALGCLNMGINLKRILNGNIGKNYIWKY